MALTFPRRRGKSYRQGMALILIILGCLPCLGQRGMPIEYYRAMAELERGEKSHHLSSIDSLYRTDHIDALGVLASRLYIASNQLDSARSILYNLPRKQVDKSALIARVELAIAEGREKDAVDTVASLLMTRDPIYPQTLYAMNTLIALRRTRAWDSLFNEVYQPTDIQTLHNRILHLKARAEWTEILETLREAKGNRYLTGKLGYYQCLALLRTGNINEAYRLSKRLIKRTSREIDIITLHAEVLSAKGRSREALRILNHAEIKDPYHPALLFTKGKALRLYNRLAESQEYLNNYLSIHPYDTAALVLMVNIHQRLEQWAQALKYCNRLIEGSEGNSKINALITRSTLLRLSGNPRLALQQLEQLKPNEPNLVDTITRESARCYIALKDRRRACALLYELSKKGVEGVNREYSTECLNE